MINIGKVAVFAAGVLFGTAGIKALSSKEAKKAYVQCTAAGLRIKDYVVDTVTTIQENAEDIYAEAKLVNTMRDIDDDIYDDESEDEAVTE